MVQSATRTHVLFLSSLPPLSPPPADVSSHSRVFNLELKPLIQRERVTCGPVIKDGVCRVSLPVLNVETISGSAETCRDRTL